MLTVDPLEKARLYIESHQRTIDESKESGQNLIPGPCITISRQTGAGAHTVSNRLIKLLKNIDRKENALWSLFDKNLIEKVLEDHHLPQRLSSFLKEEKYSSFKSIVNQMLGDQPEIWTLVHRTAETILNLAEIGNVIIIGRGGNIITSNLHNAFHVRLIAPFEKRIKYVKEYYNLSRQEAIDFISENDAARNKYLTTSLQRNVDDPVLYHITLNTHLLRI